MKLGPAQIPENDIARAYIAYSRFIALLALALPVVLWLSSKLAGCVLRGSLSAYYYGDDFQRNWFVATLCVIAAFMLLYRGVEGIEANVLNVAGVMAVLVAFCPAAEEEYSCVPTGGTAPGGTGSGGIVPWIHDTAALALFTCIIVVGVVLPFLKNRTRAPSQRLQLRWYAGSAGVILLGMVCALLGKWLLRGTGLFFWGELLLVAGFGWFWYLRSRSLGQRSARAFLLDEAGAPSAAVAPEAPN